jgi:integral membrane protein
MKKFFATSVGRLRLYGFLEGVSLLALIFIAVPMKYIGGDPTLVKAIGPVHGALFLLFVFGAITVGVEYQWKFKETTWKVIAASFVPFGTFYVDHAILKHMPATES